MKEIREGERKKRCGWKARKGWKRMETRTAM
jgi:hypothetical protein